MEVRMNVYFVVMVVVVVVVVLFDNIFFLCFGWSLIVVLI